MGRWNENGAWKEFRRWLAAAGMGMYVAFSLYAIFFLAEPFGVAVIQSSGVGIAAIIVSWMFRIIVILNLVAVVWMVLRTIGRQEGEWPD
ncbi:MAG: hypothetical protein IJZ44_06200 [Lachnospiraceae bacterium]|nr:hypothetical protein [Lachnospiraceae bacterium]